MLVTVVLGSALIALHVRISGAASWVYAYSGATEADAAAQDATWGGICVSGKEQSPINVKTTNVVTGGMLPSVDTFITADVSYLTHTGKGFQLFETAPDTHTLNEANESEVDHLGPPKGYSMFSETKYNFYQVHWHTPSENTVDGKYFPLEAHFVHQIDDPSLHGTYEQLAVIGLLYDWGECNEFLDRFWSAFPESTGKIAFTAAEGMGVDLNEHLANELQDGYYHWWGSLTTPPCTEGVNWNLLKAHQTVCTRQVEAIQAAINNTIGLKFNNRVIQPLYNRVVADTGPQHHSSVQMLVEEAEGVARATLVVIIISLIGLLVGLFVVVCMLFRLQEKTAEKINDIERQADERERLAEENLKEQQRAEERARAEAEDKRVAEARAEAERKAQEEQAAREAERKAQEEQAAREAAQKKAEEERRAREAAEAQQAAQAAEQSQGVAGTSQQALTPSSAEAAQAAEQSQGVAGTSQHALTPSSAEVPSPEQQAQDGGV